MPEGRAGAGYATEAVDYLLVGGSPEPSSVALVRRLAAGARFVVAVDRGAEVLRAAGVAPWAYVGDSDSVAPAARAWAQRRAEFELLRPSHKDETDLALALDVVAERTPAPGPSTCLVTCVSGGRVDHQLGVLGTLRAHAQLQPQIVEDAYRAWILVPSARAQVAFGAQDVGRTVSALSLSDATVVSESGLTWNLDRVPLGVLSDLGVSNVVETPAAAIACHEGCLGVFLQL